MKRAIVLWNNISDSISENKRGTSKVGAIYKAHKAQSFQKLKRKQFLRTKKYHLEKSHNAENGKSGHPFSCKKYKQDGNV